MERDKFLKFLGICKKSGKLISGDFSVEKSISKHKIKLLVLAEDSAKSKLQKYTELAALYNIELIQFGSAEELGGAIGRSVCAIIGITDINQKNKLLSLFQTIS